MLGLFVGSTLLVAGLVLLSHSSYQNYGGLKGGTHVLDVDEESGVQHEKNDCVVPFCFFRASNVKNHETWVVSCLLSGSAILLLSMV